MRLDTVLTQIGLSDGEQKVYLALLDLGEATSGPIAERSGVSASKVYQVMQRLMKKGLAGAVTAQGTKRFKATHPRAILDYLKTKEDEARELRAAADKALPSLLAKYDENHQETEVQMYRGVKSLGNAFYTMIDELGRGGEYKVIGANYGKLTWIWNFFNHYHEERVKRGVHAKILFQQSLDIPESTRKNSEIRLLPWNYDTPLQITTWKDTTYLMLMQEEPFIFTIKSKELTRGFDQYFETLWNQEVQTLKGDAGIKAVLLDALNEKEMLFIGGKGYVVDRLQGWFEDEYVPRVKKSGFRWRNLVLPEARGHKVLELPFAESRFLPPGDYPPSVIWIYGDKIANVLWKEEPLVFVVNNEAIADGYRQYFNALWNQDTQTWRGDTAITMLIDDLLDSKSDLYLIGANSYLPGRFPKEFSRMCKGMEGKTRHHLARENTRNEKFNHLPRVEANYLPGEMLGPLVIWIYGDIVSQVLWEKEIKIFRIQNRSVADDYRTYFKFMKRMSKR